MLGALQSAFREPALLPKGGDALMNKKLPPARACFAKCRTHPYSQFEGGHGLIYNGLSMVLTILSTTHDKFLPSHNCFVLSHTATYGSPMVSHLYTGRPVVTFYPALGVHFGVKCYVARHHLAWLLPQSKAHQYFALIEGPPPLGRRRNHEAESLILCYCNINKKSCDG